MKSLNVDNNDKDRRTAAPGQGTLVAGDGAHADENTKRVPDENTGPDCEPDRRGADAGDDSVKSSGPVAADNTPSRATPPRATGR